MTEKRYIVNTDCLYNEVLDTKFSSNGVDKPTKEEIEDKEYLIVCDVYPKSVADKLCERLNRYENENKKFKVENEQLKNEVFDWKASAEDYLKLGKSLKKENEQLKKELSDIGGQLLMLDNCDNWDYDRMKHTVREIAEIIGYNGTINPKVI